MRRHTEIKETPEQRRQRLEEAEEAARQAIPTPRPFPRELCGEIMYLQTADLSLHPKMQKYRHIDRPGAARRLVDKIKADFNARAIFLIGVVPNRLIPGKYFVFMAGHRFTALKELGYTDCRCEVVILPPEQEWELVRLVDDESTRLSRSRWDRFSVHHLYGEEKAIAIEGILQSHGLTLVGSMGWRAATQTFEWAYDLEVSPAKNPAGEAIHVGAVLNSALDIMCAAFQDLPTKNDQRVVAVFKALVGLDLFYRQRAADRYDPARLAQVLKNTTARQLRQTAREKKTIGDDLTKKIISIAIDSYNSRMEREMRLPLYTGGQVRPSNVRRIK
jgi:hypothetical protein